MEASSHTTTANMAVCQTARGTTVLGILRAVTTARLAAAAAVVIVAAFNGWTRKNALKRYGDLQACR